MGFSETQKVKPASYTNMSLDIQYQYQKNIKTNLQKNHQHQICDF